MSLCDDPNEQQILEIAKRMGLERVGWIVTDLVPDKDGKVKDVRNKDTHYVTAEGEKITTFRLSNKFSISRVYNRRKTARRASESLPTCSKWQLWLKIRYSHCYRQR